MYLIAANLFLYLPYLVAENFLGSPVQEPAGTCVLLKFTCCILYVRHGTVAELLTRDPTQ